ncbi:cbb3-type cytochrome c oxidase N-terminal domain-containing protein [Algoriphagus sanaruensis]|uniref:Cytochrome C oxidase subunit III n=1 Tax=Algoriphagus sanaruensis TaxID=1727163 RepID=A0A142EMK8_9BACT|nr:cbb3-type cytochrome c oxidase N-terminal domain-containing protein [Algoriphagus sanaruensis]AMQ56363.1 cytochrome C oxidase subunit III [Algoriphagus sanaruensis]
MKKLFAILTLMGLSGMPVFAQTAESNWYTTLSGMDSSQLTLLIILGVVLMVIVLLLILMVYLMSFMAEVFKRENPQLANEPTWWESFKERFVTGKLDKVGGKEEEAKMMADHSYDGITELDNFMPPWLQYVFIGTVGFAIIYFVNYSVLGNGPTGEEEYQEELRIEAIAAEARKASLVAGIDETSVIFDESAAALASGKSIFETNCAACHAADGGGGVGPNLTDEYWLHGGGIQDVFKVVKYGVVEKGMIPWQDQLSPEEIQQVSSYILTLKGTSPANPKEPQGELVGSTPAEIVTPVTDSTTVIASIK